MSAILTRVDDPRDALDRARRIELVHYARANGINEIELGKISIPISDAPAILIRKKLRANKLTRIAIPNRILGQVPNVPITERNTAIPDTAPEIDATDDLERQFAAPSIVKTPAQMSINELRAECHRLNIKLSRRDNMITMREKIEQRRP